MAQFDRDIDSYQKASGETLRMLPDGPQKQNFVLNSARLTTWELLKAEIDNVRRAQDAASSTPQPMDLSAYGTQNLDAFQKGKSRCKGKGKYEGKPKDNVPTTPCSICGKAGHFKKDCCPRWLGRGEQAQRTRTRAKTARTRPLTTLSTSRTQVRRM